MIKIENTQVYGWEVAIRGMRNPKNSWGKSDTVGTYVDGVLRYVDIGENDLTLMKNLSNAGNDHGKFLRMITVTADITAPLYWWKEFDTYKIGTVANSCSTMHKIHSKPIELSDFSMDDFYLGDDSCLDLKDMFINVVADCEYLRKQYLIADKNAKNEDSFSEAERKHFRRQAKRFWKGLVQLLPSSYNQKRTVQINYQVAKAQRAGRRHHKLDEWRDYCDWLEGLPYFKEICLGEVKE